MEDISCLSKDLQRRRDIMKAKEKSSEPSSKFVYVEHHVKQQDKTISKLPLFNISKLPQLCSEQESKKIQEKHAPLELIYSAGTVRNKYRALKLKEESKAKPLKRHSRMSESHEVVRPIDQRVEPIAFKEPVVNNNEAFGIIFDNLDYTKVFRVVLCFFFKILFA